MKKVDVLSLDGRLLKTFLTVYQTESVTRAAEQLGVTQSSVSHSLNRLREYIGDPLFSKRGRGITPTNTARRIVPAVSDLLSQMESLSQHKDYDPHTDDGTFTVATNVTELLPALLAVKKNIRVLRNQSKLRFIDLGDRANALSYLEKDKADLAITASIGTYPLELSVHRLYQDPIVCFFDPHRREAPDTVEQYCAARHAVLDFGGTNKSLVDRALENSGLARSVHLAASNSYALARLSKGTDLVSTLPRGLASTAYAGFQFCAAPFPLPAVSYDLAWHRRIDKSSRHIWFRNVIIGAVTSSPHLD